MREQLSRAGNDPRLIQAAQKSYEEKGYGLASVRFICGTQDSHKQLEAAISHFLGMDDTILYSSCFVPMAVCLKRFWGRRTR